MNSLPSFAVPLIRASPCMYSFTTAMQNKLRSVQKMKSNEQKGEYWFPCGKIIYLLDPEIRKILVSVRMGTTIPRLIVGFRNRS